MKPIVLVFFAFGLPLLAMSPQGPAGQKLQVSIVKNDSEGPSSVKLAAAIRTIFTHPKAGALGLASIPFGERDKAGLSLEAAYRLVEGAVLGIQVR